MTKTGCDSNRRKPPLLTAGLCLFVSVIVTSLYADEQGNEALQIQPTKTLTASPSHSALHTGADNVIIRPSYLAVPSPSPIEVASARFYIPEAKPASAPCISMDCPLMAPYPVSFLQEAGELEVNSGGVLSFFSNLLTSSVIASSTRAAKVFGTHIVKDGKTSEHLQRVISLIGSAFIVARTYVGGEGVAVEASQNSLESIHSAVESSLNKLEVASSLESLQLPEPSVSTMGNIAQKASELGFTGSVKMIASNWGLINFSVISAMSLTTRVQETLYRMGLLGDSIELFDDDSLVNQVAFFRFTLPADSRNRYFARISGALSDFFYGQDDYRNLRTMSVHQPYIDITPKSKRGPLSSPAFDSNPYLRNLVTLADAIPEGATLRIFPGTHPETGMLTYTIVMLYFTEDGQLVSQSPVIELDKHWGSNNEGVWLTDKIASGQLIKKRHESLIYKWFQGDDLPVYNPIDADMIAELALAVDQINEHGFMLPPRIPGSSTAPAPVTVKQSGFYLAVVDAGGVVFYVDNFAGQNRESAQMTIKVTSIDDVDEDRLVTLENQRIHRHEIVYLGEKPYDPVRDRMEMAIIKLIVNNIITNYADAGVRFLLGMDQIRYRTELHGLFGEGEQSLFLRRVIRELSQSSPSQMPALLPLSGG